MNPFERAKADMALAVRARTRMVGEVHAPTMRGITLIFDEISKCAKEFRVYGLKFAAYDHFIYIRQKNPHYSMWSSIYRNQKYWFWRISFDKDSFGRDRYYLEPATADERVLGESPDKAIVALASWAINGCGGGGHYENDMRLGSGFPSPDLFR